MQSNGGNSRYLFEFVSRMQGLRKPKVEFEEADVDCTSVEWQGHNFHCDGREENSIFEVFFEIDRQVTGHSNISQFYINRDTSSIDEKFERTVNNVKLRIYVNSYSSLIEMKGRAKEHIPTSINQQRVACYAFDYEGSNNLHELMEEFVDELPVSFFSRAKILQSQVIPWIELALLDAGFVIFEPALNKFTKWSETMTWENAIRLRKSG